MRICRVAAVPLLLLSSLLAHADEIDSFNFQSDLSDGSIAQGVVNIDTTAGVVENSNFSLTLNGTTEATFTSPDDTQSFGSAYLAEFQGSTTGYTYELLLPNSSLVGYQGGYTCTDSSTCSGYPSGVFLPSGDATALDGSLAPAPTPEPAGVLLLGTGLIAIAILMRQRAAQANYRAAEELPEVGS